MPPIMKKRLPLFAVPLILSSSVLLAPQAFAAPQANADNYTITQGQNFTFTPMENDATDPGHWLFVEAVDDPTGANAGATAISDGFAYNGVRSSGSKITYTPAANFTGTTTFFYGVQSVPNGGSANPNNLTNSAKVTITVTEGGGGIPQPPASPPPIAYGQRDSVVSGETVLIDALSNDAGVGLTITDVGNPFGRTGDGGFFSTGTASIVNNKIRFVADGPNFDGPTTFFYQITDSQGRTNFGSTTVDVSPATGSTGPKAGDDNAEYDFADRQGGATWIAPFWNDTGAELKITAVGSNQNNTTVIVDNGKQVSYTPRSGFSGRDTFTYTVTDKFGGTDQATITVAVVGVGPTATFPRPVANGDAYDITNRPEIALNVLANDEDNDPNGRTLSSVTGSSRGVTGVVGNNVVYTPNAGFVSGSDSFFYTITDTLGRTSSAQVTVTIPGGGNTGGGTGGGTGVNQSPDAVEDIDRIGIVPGATQTERNVTSFVLANDTDPDGDSLSVQSVGAARFGSVRESGGQVFYTPPSFLTSGGFTYVVSDGNGGTDAAAVTFGIVDSVNPTTNPVVSNENITVAPGGSFTINVIANDIDPDGDALNLDQISGFVQGTITSSGNSITYTANSNASGTDAIFYGVADGQGGNGSGTVNITIQ